MIQWLSRELQRLKRKKRSPRGSITTAKLDSIEAKVDTLTRLHAAAERRRVQALPPGTPLGECEFKVYSQFGEDGILQHLIRHVPIADRSFVEFGVEDFIEANCRYLMEVEPWRGLVLDSDPQLEPKIRSHPLSFWRQLTPHCAFITAENIDDVLAESGFVGDIGILSIDIDGNDYWVWRAVKVVSPRIVVIEYNSVFGADHAVSIPYDKDFFRRTAHFSWLYQGASLPALVHLGREKGYAFVGSNRAGNNAFFVRNDVLGELKSITAKEGYVESTFRESRDRLGNMTYLNGQARTQVMADMPLVDIIGDRTITVGSLFR